MKSYSPNSKINKTVSIKKKTYGTNLEEVDLNSRRYLVGIGFHGSSQVLGKDQIRYTSGVQVIVYMMFIGMLYQFKFSQFSETQKNPSTSRGPSDKERGIDQM